MREFQTGYTVTDGATQTMLGDFADCRERLRLKLDGWVKEGTDKESIWFGSAFAKACELLYGVKEQAGICTDTAIDFAMLSLPEHNVEDAKQETNLLKLQAVIPTYARFWRQEDQTRTWISVEEVFDINVNGSRRRGRFDGVFEDAHGELWLLETKTKAKIESDEIQMLLAFDLQVIFYLWAMGEVYGRQPAGVLYNIVRNPGQRRKQDEDGNDFFDRVREDIDKRPEHYFQRFPAIWDTDSVKGELEGIETIEDLFRGWVAGEEPTYQNRQACRRPWRCEFLELCSSGTTSGYVQERELFRELKED